MDRDENAVVYEQPGWIIPAVVILALLAIGGLGYAYYDSTQLTAAQQAISGQMKSAQQDFSQQISVLQQKESQAEASNAQLESDLGVVTKRLRVTQGDLQKARDEAAEIQKDSEQKIADLNTDVTTQLA